MITKMKTFLKQKWGSVAIEFALVMPVYILVLSSGYELTMYALLQNKIQRLAGVMGDTIARQDLSREKVEAYINESQQFVEPFGFLPGKITVSQIQNIEESENRSDMRISWQVSFQGNASNIGSPGDFPSSLPDSFQLLGKQTAILVEVKYDFTSFVFASVINDQELYSRYVTVPRKGEMNTLLGEESIF